jgi:hypothetical protein
MAKGLWGDYTAAGVRWRWRFMNPPYFVSIRKIYIVDIRGVKPISVSQFVSIRNSILRVVQAARQ